MLTVTTTSTWKKGWLQVFLWRFYYSNSWKCPKCWREMQEKKMLQAPPPPLLMNSSFWRRLTKSGKLNLTCKKAAQITTLNILRHNKQALRLIIIMCIFISRSKYVIYTVAKNCYKVSMPELAEIIKLHLDLLHVCVCFHGNPLHCHLRPVCQQPFEYLQQFLFL